MRDRLEIEVARVSAASPNACEGLLDPMRSPSLSNPKSRKPLPHGRLSAEIIESICAAVALEAEDELGSSRAWEDWVRSAADDWSSKYKTAVLGGALSKNALRDAAASARDCAVSLAKQWAVDCCASRCEAVLGALPSREDYGEQARALASKAEAQASGGHSDEDRSPDAAGSTNSSLEAAVHSSTESALRNRCALDLAASLKPGSGGRGVPATRQSWQELFVADAMRSMAHVRSVVVVTALTVVQETAAERARALVDTLSRRLAMDCLCGRLGETLHEVHAAAAGDVSSKDAPGGPSSMSGGMFWREIARDAAKTLNREGVRRLIARHV